MTIPKYILHPALILTGCGLILWLVWTRIPSANDVVNSLTNVTTTKTLPDPKLLSEILDFTDNGMIVFKNNLRHYKLEGFSVNSGNASDYAKLKTFFIGKLLQLPEENSKDTLLFPIQLYDPLCFKSDAKVAVHCPIILEK